MMFLVLKLLLAHILGDFILQPDYWVKEKKKRKYKSSKLYLHIGVHAFLLILVLQFDIKYWLGLLVIVFSHLIIDLAKLYASDKLNNFWLFFIDQVLHLLVIGVVVNYYEPFDLEILNFYNAQTVLFIISILLITSVTSVVIKVSISKWKPEDGNDQNNLKNTGAYIGMLERLFIFGFIVTNYWEGIGFLIAAKSVFRFGDLSSAKNRNLTEYILIGTLLSFGLATLISIGYLYLQESINIKNTLFVVH